MAEPMRIAAVDAREDSDDARRVVALALAQAPERLFLFGATATIAAAQVKVEETRRDERYLDMAARWLLDRGGGPPPTRAGLGVPLLEIGVAVREEGASAPIPASARAIELVSGQLCMAVTNRASIAAEEWGNAALWIAGGEREPGVYHDRGRPVVVPGFAGAGGGLAVVDVGVGEARICMLDGGGALAPALVVPFGGGARMVVRAAGAHRA